MCLAVPGKIIEVYDTAGMRMCKIDFGGVIREACLQALPEARVGDFTIIHAGFALSILSEEEANETLSVLRELGEFEDEMSAGVS
jgi:hydrogenase expression/formation protein HypC